jgi:hypothetical protein
MCSDLHIDQKHGKITQDVDITICRIKINRVQNTHLATVTAIVQVIERLNPDMRSLEITMTVLNTILLNSFIEVLLIGILSKHIR